ILDKNLLMYNIARLTTASDKTDSLASFSTTFIVLGILSVCLLFFNSFFKLRELSFVSEEIME
ncbi:MAG: hypothetical protein NTV87_08525, partial [Ignavibacteriae bacterium]|nr:hypothetical protein [Ignavibacteriota bacterium]